MGTQITTDFFTANGKGFVLQGPLQEILLQNPAHGVRAVPQDIPACRLEFGITGAYPTGAWFGDVGHLTKAQADSWYVSGVLVFLASGSTATIDGVPSVYTPGVGWGPVGSARAVSAYTPKSLMLLGNSIAAGALSCSLYPGAWESCQHRGDNVTLGQLVRPSYWDLTKPHVYLQCTTEGRLSSEIEPKHGEIGSYVMDGTAKFLVVRYPGLGLQYQAAHIWHTLSLSGQSLDLRWYVGASGRPSTYVIEVAKYLLDSGATPDVVGWYGVWENDIPTTPTIQQASANLANFNAFNTALLDSGAMVIATTTFPGGACTASIPLRTIAAYYDKGMLDFQSKNKGFFVDESPKAWESTVYGSDYCPDTAIAYVTQTGTIAATDGVHPNKANHYKTAVAWAKLLNSMNLPTIKYQSYAAGIQLFPNPKMLGTSGTTSGGSSATGAVATGLIVEMNGTTTVGLSRIVPRTDNVPGNWQEVSFSGTAFGYALIRIWQPLIGASGLSVGDKVQVLVEYQLESLTGNIDTASIVFTMQGSTTISFGDMVLGGNAQAYLGQAIGPGLVTLHDMPVKMPTEITPGTTQLKLSLQIGCGRGEPWSGKVRIGRVNVLKI